MVLNSGRGDDLKRVKSITRLIAVVMPNVIARNRCENPNTKPDTKRVLAVNFWFVITAL